MPIVGRASTRPPADQTVAIFSSREEVPVLKATIDATTRAVRCKRAVVDVIVNGNRALADAIAPHYALEQVLEPGTSERILRIWFVAMGDKAHAWNEYIRRIWSGSQIAFFVDGMARPHAGSLDAMASGLASHPQAWAATAVPTHGRSASTQRKILEAEGGIHGNLYAVRGEVLQRLATSGFNLPRGIYRTDPLLGAALCFSLDPSDNVWNRERIHVEWTASWDYDPLKWWRIDEVLTHFRRVKRQLQGVVELAAIRQWLAIDKRAPEDLPQTAAEMVSNWIAGHANEANGLFHRRRGCREAVQRLLEPRDWSAASVEPILLGQLRF